MANLLLQDPFGVLKEYPEKLTHTLEVPVAAVCVKFSPRGDYLAVGCSNGAIIIYDMDSLKPIAMLGTHSGAHTRSVQSVCWSNDGRYLWSSGRDWYAKLALGYDSTDQVFPTVQVRWSVMVLPCGTMERMHSDCG